VTQVEVRKIYCLGCGYLLHGLTTPQCPECGRAFDPRNSETFARSPRRWPAQSTRALPFTAPAMLFLFWWVYLLFVPARAPVRDGVELTLFFVGMVLKVATIVSLPIVLARGYAVMAARPRVAMTACFVWASCAVVIVGGWMLVREMRPSIRNLDDLAPLTASPAWVPAKELAVAVLLCAVHAVVGLRLGRYPSLAAPVGVMATLLVLATVALLDTQLEATFNTGGMCARAVAVDLMYFFAPLHPHTTVASTIYLAFAGSSAWLVGHYGGDDQSSPIPK
jgi:hypothetical protein